MVETFAIVTSVVALAVSVTTAWLTFFHRATVQMTIPSMIVFSYDERGSRVGYDPKVMVRCLMFSTGERGCVIETLFARVRHGVSKQLFPIWGMDADNKLVRGGGLFVGKSGVVAWHHFVVSGDRVDFRFKPGTYELDVFARVHGSGRPVKLWSTVLSLPESCTPNQHDGREQVWFDQEVQSGEFCPRLESRGEVT